MYGVYSRAITKGRNNPDPNIEDLICVRSNQWCIRTQDSIKCKKLYTGLDRRILTCYNNALYPGIAKLVSRLVWENTPSRIKNSITGCSAVGSAPALGVPWLCPGQGMAKCRKVLQHLRLRDFTRLPKTAQKRL